MGVRKFLEYAVPLMLVLPFLLYIIPQMAGASTAYIVQSGSMEPKIMTGSVVLVESVPVNEISVDDVITFVEKENDDTKRTTHRVINITEMDNSTMFLTKGDANEDPDPKMIHENNVEGKVKFSVPKLGYIINWAGTRRGFVLLLVIPATFLITKELWNIRKELKESEDDETVEKGDDPEEDRENHEDSSEEK